MPKAKVKVTQSCLTLCDPHGLYRPWNSPGQDTGVGRHSLLQGIFPTQESNPGLPHCRWILYQLSHKASVPEMTGALKTLENQRVTVLGSFHLASGFPSGSDGKESACNAGDAGLIPASGRSPGEGNGNPLQYSCLGNFTDKGAGWQRSMGCKEWDMTK